MFPASALAIFNVGDILGVVTMDGRCFPVTSRACNPERSNGGPQIYSLLQFSADNVQNFEGSLAIRLNAYFPFDRPRQVNSPLDDVRYFFWRNQVIEGN